MSAMQVWSQPHAYVRAKDEYSAEATQLLRDGIAAVEHLSLAYYVCPTAYLIMKHNIACLACAHARFVTLRLCSLELNRTTNRIWWCLGDDLCGWVDGLECGLYCDTASGKRWFHVEDFQHRGYGSWRWLE